jgi:hypothetical protein
MVTFIAVLEQALQVQQYLCANHTKSNYFDREIKYLDFISGHQFSAETECPKKIRWTNKWVQVCSTSPGFGQNILVPTVV